MGWIAGQSGVAYGESERATKAHRILADHGRGMTFLAVDGVTPSNEGRGYVMRRVIRRAVLQAGRIGLEPPFLAGLAGVVVEQMGEAYPELAGARAEIERVLAEEEQRFGETLARGLTLFEEAAGDGEISGEEAFKLHDTYGFPLELTGELARERGLPVDEDRFHDLMEEQRLRSRKVASEVEVRVSGDVRSEFVGYEKTDVLTAILAYEDLGDGRFQAKLEQSPFYPAGGGQVSDSGYIEDEETGARAELVEATRLPDDDQVLTFEGEGFAAGMRVRAVVPWSVRFPTMANHTATHLLHKALQDVLGEHARQAGSAVRPDKLRFDFSHPQPVTDEERAELERRVNEAIFRNLPVRAYIVPIEEARRLGAMMLFGEKYGDEVRLVDIAGYSRELCGGTHVRATAEIGPFVITSESSVGSGTRRIEAVTSGEAYALLHGRAEEAAELRAELERARRERPKRAEKVEVEVEPRSEEAIGGVNVFVGQAVGVDADALLEESDRIKQARAPAAVVLGAAEDGRRPPRRQLRPVARGAARCGRRDQGGGSGGRRRRRRTGDDGARRRPRSREARRRSREGRGGPAPGARVKVVALDYGSARTGVAVSDPTGTIARPLGVVERAASEDGLAQVGRIVRDEGAERVVVGLPLTLRGEHGAQARETDAFVEALRAALDVPVESYDERFTTGLAASVGSDEAPEDARAAAHLLSSYLAWSSAGRE